jgi:6-pyruvoyltetrahydropterin/6-carboxytetrahydropterin synthase
MYRYRVVKTYGNDNGWSCTFRQWRAHDSHCHFIHGYSLGFELTFECETLDSRNWCLDFGGLKELKAWMQSMFDHRLLVAEDDPKLDLFRQLVKEGIADITIVAATSCEKFAEMVYMEAARLLDKLGEWPRVRLVSVRVSEHGGNSAIYLGDG